MSLLQTIIESQQKARKEKDSVRLSVLQLLLSELKNEKIKLGRELSDEEMQKVLSTQVKRLNDSMKDFKAASRDDLVEGAQKELDILNLFLPEQLTDEELETIVKKVITELNATSPSDLGKVMGKVMSEVKSKADGNRVRESVIKNLS